MHFMPDNLPYNYNETCNAICKDGFWGDALLGMLNPSNICLGDEPPNAAHVKLTKRSCNNIPDNQECIVTCPSGYVSNAATLACD